MTKTRMRAMVALPARPTSFTPGSDLVGAFPSSDCVVSAARRDGGRSVTGEVGGEHGGAVGSPVPRHWLMGLSGVVRVHMPGFSESARRVAARVVAKRTAPRWSGVQCSSGV